MAKEMTTQVWFGNTKFSFGAFEDDPNEVNLMDFCVTHEDEPEDCECRSWCTALTIDEMEYLARRILDAVDYQRKQKEKGGQ